MLPHLALRFVRKTCSVLCRFILACFALKQKFEEADGWRNGFSFSKHSCGPSTFMRIHRRRSIALQILQNATLSYLYGWKTAMSSFWMYSELLWTMLSCKMSLYSVQCFINYMYGMVIFILRVLFTSYSGIYQLCLCLCLLKYRWYVPSTYAVSISQTAIIKIEGNKRKKIIGEIIVFQVL